MNTNWQDAARAALQGAESGGMTFPESVRLLMEASFDGYAVDFRRAIRIYYRPDGETVALETVCTSAPVAKRFDAASLKEALREAQALTPGFTYQGFCAKAAGAGCAGYFVSLLGKRVLYYGRTGETYTEYFPDTKAAQP